MTKIIYNGFSLIFHPCPKGFIEEDWAPLPDYVIPVRTGMGGQAGLR